ncbi:MAG: hypothetical protein ACOCRK_02135 [bacterium]
MPEDPHQELSVKKLSEDILVFCNHFSDDSEKYIVDLMYQSETRRQKIMRKVKECGNVLKDYSIYVIVECIIPMIGDYIINNLMKKNGVAIYEDYWTEKGQEEMLERKEREEQERIRNHLIFQELDEQITESVMETFKDCEESMLMESEIELQREEEANAMCGSILDLTESQIEDFEKTAKPGILDKVNVKDSYF